MVRALAVSLSSGAAYALFGVCIVLVYRTSGTLHFAITAIGALGAFTMLSLVDGGTGIVAAALAAIAMGAAIGAVMGAVFVTWFRDKQRLTKSAVTIALLLGLLAAGFRIFGDKPRAARPFFPRPFHRTRWRAHQSRHRHGRGPGCRRGGGGEPGPVSHRGRRPPPSDGGGPGERRTHRHPGRRSHGRRLGVAGSLAVLGAVLVGPSRPAAFAPLVFLLLPGLAAGLAGGFVRIWPTLLTGFVIAFGETYAARFSAVSKYRASIPFFFILVLLLWQRRSEVWDDTR